MGYDPIKQLQDLPQLPTLRPGQSAWAVRLLRRVLGAHGYGDPAWADPGQTPDVSAEYDQDLVDAVKKFQADTGLTVDGIVGPQTWGALRGESQEGDGDGKDLRETIVKIARSLCELGVYEHGSNRGVVVEAMLIHAGGRPGQPWCMAFVDFVYEWACELCGVQPALDPGLSCSALVRQAKEKGLLRTDVKDAQPGDLYILKGGDTGYKHVGIVIGIAGNMGDMKGSLLLIEGNTNEDGHSEGNGVYLKERRPKDQPGVVILPG